jgi:uncharacterized Fe-S cluster-containing radical SAM superfamily protein
MRDMGYDPVRRAEEVAAEVCRGPARRYHRFRPARFYGGIATADCVGCNLRCAFCWSWRQVLRPGAFGAHHDPQEVASRLAGIAQRKGYRQVRISGNEPTLARAHLLEVLERVPPELTFLLETNGILLGHDEGYARALARFPNLHVRVSLKGTCEEEFSRLTGADPGGFALQLRALENLAAAGVEAHPAVMVSFSPAENVRLLRRRLARISPDFEDFEAEELALWGGVEERLRKAGLSGAPAHDPRRLPPDQV